MTLSNASNATISDDTGVEKARYNIDGGSWNNLIFDGYNEYTAKIDTTQLNDGAHTINVEVEDFSGKVVTESVDIKVKNSSNKKSTGSSTPGFEGLILITAIGIGILSYSNYNKKIRH